MFAKLVLVIVTAGGAACGLLAMRQARLQAAHELAQVQFRIARHDQTLWAVRSRIASMVTPSRVQELASGIGPMRPLLAEPIGGSAPSDAVARGRTPQDEPTPEAIGRGPDPRDR